MTLANSISNETTINFSRRTFFHMASAHTEAIQILAKYKLKQKTKGSFTSTFQDIMKYMYVFQSSELSMDLHLKKSGLLHIRASL
jgi:hypothetical protein